MEENLRETGITAVGDAPWGTHFCQFYETASDLTEIVVPYFKAGLDANELCMWVTSGPVDVDVAWRALAKGVPDLDRYRDQGLIEILPHSDWYLRDGHFDKDRVLEAWVDRLDQAFARGCAGLRVSGNTFWLEKRDWESFAEYEAAIDAVLGQHRILALCTYALDRCGAPEVADVIKNHQFALLKREGAWHRIESFDRRRAFQVVEARRSESEARYRLLSWTSGRLLAADDPQAAVDDLCRGVMEHLGCDVFFNFLLDEASGRLHLNACAGIPSDEARRIEWLDLGVAVCGCVARDRRRMHAENVGQSSEEITALIRSYGVDAYCCHPLMAGERLLGTLSFGTRARPRFTDDEVELMQTVAAQVAIAIERMRANQALSLANAQLIEADRRKNEFLAVLSHELRNPLAPIQNSLYILDRAPAGGEQARRAQNVIARQVRQLAGLVNDLLDVTRISRNKIQLQRETLDLADVVRRTVEDHRPMFEPSSIGLEVDVGAIPAWVLADRTRIVQIVGNLLQNAAKFTQPGGRVRVSVSVDDGQATLRVCDDGVGMAPETLARLFQPFMQADDSLDRSRGGLGLGLALVKGLVELHGGRIEASSEGLDKGTELVMRLPSQSTPPPRPEDARTLTLSHRRVLIIEDNVDAADSLREMLELIGHQVAVAYDGTSGLERVRSFCPDIVLCDIGLPGMDGYQIARAIRMDNSLDRLRLVALSGYALPEDQRRARDVGFDRHLAKPPSAETLESVIGSLD